MMKFGTFKKKYADAVKSGDKQFMVEGRVVLTSYAKYMIEYLKMRKVRDNQDITFTSR